MTGHAQLPNGSTPRLRPPLKIALKLLAANRGEGSLTIGATQAEGERGLLPGWAWINHATGRALERRGLAVTEEHSVLDGPDEIRLTDAGQEVARGL